jgi:hypothetical protein
MVDPQLDNIIGELVVEIGTMTILRMGVMRMLGAEQSPLVGIQLDEMVERFSVRIDSAALRVLELNAQRKA